MTRSVDKYDAAQDVLRFIFDNENTDTNKILDHLQRLCGPAVTLAAVGETVDWLKLNGYIDGTFTFGPDALFLKPTEKGEASILSGRTIKGLLSQTYVQPEPSVSNNFSIGTNHGNAAQGDRNQLTQININPEAFSGLLEVMRSHGDNETADEVQALESTGDTPGALRKLFDRFTEKSADAAAGRAVEVSSEYAAAALPWFAVLLGRALGVPVRF